MMLLAKLVVLRIAEAMIDWAGGPQDPDDRLSRVIMAYGKQPIALRGTKADIDSAARNLADQTKSDVLVMEPVEVVVHSPGKGN